MDLDETLNWLSKKEGAKVEKSNFRLFSTNAF